MAVYNYRKFKISLNEDSKKVQGLRPGDIVRRQYIDNNVSIYSLMCVLDTGVEQVSVRTGARITDGQRSYFIGALLEGDAPQSEELLDFVRTTNLYNDERLGAIYMTASDSDSPYIDVIGAADNRSLCYPTAINNVSWQDPYAQYTVDGQQYVSARYIAHDGDCNRICELTKNSVATDGPVGLRQIVDRQLANPDRVLISYKAKASRTLANCHVSVEYEDGTRSDGNVTTTIDTEWKYYFHAVTIDNSGRYRRVVAFNFNDALQEGDVISISDLNIILLSSVANFGEGMKMRVGRLTGISDPVFGTLEDYGMYAQRLYATRQVNISGTLTAGDENGFGCTFYAGKIHKNVVINSIACDFASATEIVADEPSPVGIGEVYRSAQEILLNVQTNSWLKSKLGKTYTFSFWAKSDVDCDVLVSQNDFTLKTISVAAGDWQRYSVSYRIQEPYSDVPLQMGVLPSSGTLFFTAPQLESGNYPTQYQATDDVLSYVEDYGAWFAKGGIGGTIQNPLLKLNSDGSISSKGDSFIINNDGTGQFANGRFKWTHDSVILQGITIKWEDLDDEAKEELKPKSIKITGADVFILDRGEYSPKSLTLQLTETNMTSSSSNRYWAWLDTDDSYVIFGGENGRTLTILPDGTYWKDRMTLTIKCVVTLNQQEYSDTITIQKRKNGDDAYSVLITTSNGNTFKNGYGETDLVAHVYRGGVEITSELTTKDFDWIKTSRNPDTDAIFNATHIGYGNKLTITSDDIDNMAQFDCKVRIN